MISLNKQRGYTLSELMVVILIISILSISAWTYYQQRVTRAKITARTDNLARLAQQMPIMKSLIDAISPTLHNQALTITLSDYNKLALTIDPVYQLDTYEPVTFRFGQHTHVFVTASPAIKADFNPPPNRALINQIRYLKNRTYREFRDRHY